MKKRGINLNVTQNKTLIKRRHFAEFSPNFNVYGFIMAFMKVYENSNYNTTFFFTFLRKMCRKLLFCIYRD